MKPSLAIQQQAVRGLLALLETQAPPFNNRPFGVFCSFLSSYEAHLVEQNPDQAPPLNNRHVGVFCSFLSSFEAHAKHVEHCPAAYTPKTNTLMSYQEPTI